MGTRRLQTGLLCWLDVLAVERRVVGGEERRTPALTYGVMVAVMLATQIQHMAEWQQWHRPA